MLSLLDIYIGQHYIFENMSYHYYVETVAHLLKPGKLSYLIMNLLYIYKSAYGILNQ